MKKYFAKYLPVEGEIKEGDDSILNEIHFNHHRISLFKPTLENQGHIKVKLFLCSRDIKVNDKIQHVSGPIGIAFKINERGEGNRTEVLFQEENSVHIISMWLDEFFKVIGPISNNAKWVKEGDEFDKDQLIISNGEVLVFKGIINCIKIKCPSCGRFK